MSINLSYYDVTNIDILQDSNQDGSIVQSGTWIGQAFAKKSAQFGIGENRLKHRGNSQTLTIDKRVKEWGMFDIELLLAKYEASPSPAYDWWNWINWSFYGGATGSPATRPGGMYIGAKLNFATPNFWILSGAKTEQVVLKGNMVTDHLSMAVRGIAKYARLDTNDYVQGTATRRADPAKLPVIPAADVLVKINNVDVSTLINDFTLTLSRGIEGRGKSATASGTTSQIATSGKHFREITPNIFDGRMDFNIDPYDTTSTQLLNYLNDTALATCEIRIPNETNGKNIQFTASKIVTADQKHTEGQSPSAIALSIDGSTFNVATL